MFNAYVKSILQPGKKALHLKAVLNITLLPEKFLIKIQFYSLNLIN